MRTSILVCAVLLLSTSGHAACPTADLSGDCKVGLADLAVMAGQWAGEPNMPLLYDMASQWLTEGVPVDPENLVWVYIDDPGVSGHEGFNGYMSRYETTNAQYCQYLNAAKASNDITVSSNYVVGTSGPYSGQNYYYLAGPGYTVNGATYGGAARINWTGSSFTVDSGFEKHPVTYVSWYGSTAFASYYGYRLPTEWEWQAVADYNGSYTYGCGTSINNSIANYHNSTHPNGTTVVGSFDSYGYGMCDMAGNVWEWTNSIWDPQYSYRVFRGGGWLSNDFNCTVSRRVISYPYYTYYDLGFRVCR